MNTYLDVSLAYDNDIHRDYICHEKGDHIYIKGEEYIILQIYRTGAYDYNVELCPIALKGQFIN